MFADLYYLGDIELVDPVRSICARSTGGGRIAISQSTKPPDVIKNAINLYNLDDLNLIEYIIPQQNVTHLVFAPDGKHIAIAGMDQNGKRSSIYILDTDTGSGFTIPEIDDVWSLAWSPDGTQLASLQWPSFRMYTLTNLRILVYDLSLGETSSNLKTADYPWGKTTINIPLEDWSANFSLTMGRLEPCTEPP